MAGVMAAQTVRLAVVGDVHDEWDPVQDAKALDVLKPDLVLFTGTNNSLQASLQASTGDFGDENVQVVSDISILNYPKAAILGNHDCWFSSGPFKRYEQQEDDAVQAQLDLLGKCHVGYSRLDFPDLGLSVVGGRPGSSGGKTLSSTSMCRTRYGVKSMNVSADIIAKSALDAPSNLSIVFLAHNGPTGLGSRQEDICGKDWIRSGGDHGDPDLASALSSVKGAGQRKVPLVIFGHMHKSLAFGGCRKMVVVGEDQTLYLNAAVVPRIRPVVSSLRSGSSIQKEKNSNSSSPEASLHEPFERMLQLQDQGKDVPSERNFTVVDLINGETQSISEVWVKVLKSGACLGDQHVIYHK